MKPGDAVRCTRCGSEATAYTTGDPAAWKPGDALLVSWRGFRHEAIAGGFAPSLCLECRDRDLGAEPWRRQAPNRRVAICDDLALQGCRTVGFEWSTDQDVEAAYQRWVAAGRPRLALVQVHAPPAPVVAPEAKPARQMALGLQLPLFA